MKNILARGGIEFIAVFLGIFLSLWVDGKIKNIQFHLESCYLDLFFLNENKTYIFKHFDIRPSTIVSKLDKKKCVEELNNKFTLIRHPK